MQFPNLKVRMNNVNKQVLDSGEKQKRTSKQIATISAILVLVICIGLCLNYFLTESATAYFKTTGWKYFTIGAFAELANGTIGMAYGITTAAALLSMGITPIVTSSVVHISEIFTGAANGLMHFKFKNVNKLMFKKLVYPAIIGAIIGSILLFLLTKSQQFIKVIVSVYILILGFVILYNALRNRLPRRKIKLIGVIGFLTAMFDAIGCGGFGTTASTTLIAGGRNVLRTIGVVSAVKFFVAAASSITLVVLARSVDWPLLLMLVSGGLIVSPIGPYLAKKLPKKALMIILALAVIIVSLKQLFF